MAEYIEKQHLMDFLDGCIEEEKGNRSQVIVEAIKMTVERMPSENVAERKRGKWEVIDVANLDLTYGGRIYVPEFKCNQCGSYYESYIRWDEPIMPEDADFPKFCPNCGADMREWKR